MILDTDADVLHVFFRRIPPELLLRRMRCPFTSSAQSEEVVQFLLHFAAPELGRYSLDEQRMIFRRTQENVAGFLHREGLEHLAGPDGRPSLACTAFLYLMQFGARVLTLPGGEPRCNIREAGLWRSTYLPLGQDLLVCSFLAYEDFRRRQERNGFIWPAVLRSNHKALNAQLEKGMAENHFHLYGSTQTFPLAWCNMMNYPDDLETADWSQFSQFLQPVVVRDPEDCLFSSKERVRYAAYCRCRLFCALHPEQSEAGGAPQFFPQLKIQNTIRTLLYLYGAEVPQPDGRTERLDYALDNKIFFAAQDSPYRCLAGERSFLYRCFLALLRGDLKPHQQDLLYLYSLLKLQFRGEMIQVNQQLGFQNFQNYQDRKGTLLCRDSYWAEAIRMGVSEPLTAGNVTSLEARLTPKSAPSAYTGAVTDVDEKKRFADLPASQRRTPLSQRRCGAGEGAAMPYFYVIHFLKRADDPLPRSPLAQVCRHQKLRREIQQHAVALAQGLSRSALLCARVRGIDGSSNEVGCPPEVFATVFRFLRDFQPREFFRPSLFQEPPSPRLSATYHVGEDFLELASGLRAIDESVTFLELRRDDRLGHALGLGVLPEDYYAGKGYRLYTTKQERLDDLIWLLYRVRELGVEIEPELRSYLAREAETLLLYIYGGASPMEYYYAVQLRGDDPALYISGKFQRLRPLSSHYDTFKLSRRTPELDIYRENEAIARLYYLYQFGYKEKKKGAEIHEVDVTPRYLRLMRQVQNGLQAFLARKNIVIECNPSSNVLIGTFRSYQKHPLFRFYNCGPDCTDGRQLQVCINTDDLGVFDTSLAFEYALLFHMMDEELNPDGSKKFRTDDILRYVENLQAMSRLAVFPGCTRSGGEFQ